MGQYHAIYNLDKKAYYSPRDIGSNVKLLEFGEDMLPTALMITLLDGQWKNDRVCVIGDYAEDGDIHGMSMDEFEAIDFAEFGPQAREIIEDITNVKFVKDFWKLDGKTFEDIKIEVDGEISVNAFTNAPGMFTFVNHDKREKIVFSKIVDEHDGVTRCNDGTLYDAVTDGFQSGLSVMMIGLIAGSITDGARGGGDVELHQYGGSWCGNHVAIEREDDVQDYVDITDDVLKIMHEEMDPSEFWFFEKWCALEANKTTA